MAENSQPLQMANDGENKKWFPNKGQIQGTAKTNKQTTKSPKMNMRM